MSFFFYYYRKEVLLKNYDYLLDSLEKYKFKKIPFIC